jgi:hypothetical protein
MAEGLLQLILAGENHVNIFCSFLKEQTDYKGINLDQWMSFFEFAKTMKPDMSDYDDQGACSFRLMCCDSVVSHQFSFSRACIDR